MQYRTRNKASFTDPDTDKTVTVPANGLVPSYVPDDKIDLLVSLGLVYAVVEEPKQPVEASTEQAPAKPKAATK